METILLIETDPVKLVALALVLRCFGYTVLEAGSRGEAWGICCEHRGPIHLAMTDAVPDSSEFITRLQIPYAQIRAVLFVSEASSAQVADMPCKYALLQRPFRVNDLANTIRGLLDGAKIRSASSLS
jgi:CheY-like chemotaxis protein